MTSGLANQLSVVIVNYRTPALTLKCVDSLLHWGIATAENICVVDNASPDDSAARLPRELPAGVDFVASSENRGYSAGVNIGARHARNDYLLVLNPDTYFVDQSIEVALACLESDADVGLVGLDLVYPNGERQYSARRFYSLLDIIGRRTPLGRHWPLRQRISRHMMLDDWRPGVPFHCDWVMGTGFIVRRHLFDTLGGMDESYFLYMEDVDLCARIWNSGRKVLAVPGAKLIHDHQRSSASGLFNKATRYHLSSLSLYIKKHGMNVL